MPEFSKSRVLTFFGAARRIRRVPSWRCALVLLGASLLAGCADTPANAGSRVVTTGDSTAHAKNNAGALGSDSVRPVADSVFIALEGEGLRAFVASTGSARPLPFGTPSTDAVRLLAAVVGTPVEQGENVDCAAQYARWENGVTVWFVNGRFAGWSLNRGSRLTTVNGIGLGSTRTELGAAYDLRIVRSSLGEEFTIGGMAGLLESAAPDARVQHLWAGQSCIAR